jgi:hypothetical protein
MTLELRTCNDITLLRVKRARGPRSRFIQRSELERSTFENWFSQVLKLERASKVTSCEIRRSKPGRRNQTLRWVLTLILALLLTVPCGLIASAKDLELLTRYLVPVLLSQNFASVCRMANPEFLSRLPSGLGTVDEFSETIKKEITNGLTEQEAAMVVLNAANTALQAARNEMRKLNPEYPKWVSAPIQRWCYDETQSYILRVMQSDQREHEKFLAVLERAKQ